MGRKKEKFGSLVVYEYPELEELDALTKEALGRANEIPESDKNPGPTECLFEEISHGTVGETKRALEGCEIVGFEPMEAVHKHHVASSRAEASMT